VISADCRTSAIRGSTRDQLSSAAAQQLSWRVCRTIGGKWRVKFIDVPLPWRPAPIVHARRPPFIALNRAAPRLAAAPPAH
jgi:hypothetical protein